MRQDGGVRYATAVRRLRTIAARCQQAGGLGRDEPVRLAASVFDVLHKRHQIHLALDVVRMAFVFDLPATDLTWCCPPRSTGEQSFSLLVDNLMRRST